jgi:hypothetical protein
MGSYIDTSIHRWEYKLNTWDLNVVEQLVLALISRCTGSNAKEDVVFLRLLQCDSTCTQTCHRRSQVSHRHSHVLPGLLSVLWGLPPALPVSVKASRNALHRSDSLLKLIHLSLHSTSSQTLIKASSNWNTFCWCNTKCIRYMVSNHGSRRL